MNAEKQPAVAGPVEPTVRHCWPTPWLEAAMRAGFAHHKGGGEWVFLNDKLRDMLAEFGAELQRNERERCAKLCETWMAEAERHSGPEAAGWLHQMAQHIRRLKA